MNRHFVRLALVALVLVVACRKEETRPSFGSTYAQIARPAIWRVLPRTQAETLGLQPGDVITSYSDEPVKTVDELVQLQFRSVGSQGKIPITVLRGDAEMKFSADPGVLGVLPDAERYPAGLAVALKDILNYYGVTVDYDWLAALTGESFAFTARRDGCPAAWPDGQAGRYLQGLTKYYGLTFRPVLVPGQDSARTAGASQQQALATIRGRLGRGMPVLVFGSWSGSNGESWGIATRYGQNDSLLHGYALGSAGEVALNGPITKGYEVIHHVTAEPDPGDMLTTVLTQALELGQASADTGWQTGIAAYDLWIRSLDTVPFCAASQDSGRADFDRLIWTLLANKESVNGYLQDMREALPDQTELIDAIISKNQAIIGKLEGVIQSGIQVGTLERQQKLARAVNDVELIEVDLLGQYQNLIGQL